MSLSVVPNSSKYIKKLMISTNICGKKIAESGYKFRYTFEEAIKDWYNDNDNLYLQ
jgi:hypothetical protein